MGNQQLNEAFSALSTPLSADACLRLNLPLQLAATGIHPLSIENHIAGRGLPVRHYSCVDIFLEAMGAAQAGDILVIDNQGRMDEGCIGDLTALEAQASGLGASACGAVTATRWSFSRSVSLFSVMAVLPPVLSGSMRVIRRR